MTPLLVELIGATPAHHHPEAIMLGVTLVDSLMAIYDAARSAVHH